MNKDPLEITYQDLNIHDIIKERYFCYVYIFDNHYSFIGN